MDSRFERALVNDGAQLTKREAPKIGGSIAAFVIIALVLVLIIVASCTAVVFLLREEARESGQSSKSKAWYSRLADLFSTRRSKGPLKGDAVRPGVNRKSKGWIQAGREGHWDIEGSGHRENPSMQQAGSAMIPLTTPDKPRTKTSSSFNRPFVYSQPSHSPSSDTALSMEDDPHAIPGLGYPGHFSNSSQRLAPSVQSHLYSPPSSPPPRVASPEPISTVSDTVSITRDQESMGSFSTQAGPMVRTMEGGSKFIEQL